MSRTPDGRRPQQHRQLVDVLILSNLSKLRFSGKDAESLIRLTEDAWFTNPDGPQSQPLLPYTSDDMKFIKRRLFPGFVFSELDKNNGAFLITCPQYYFQLLRLHTTLDDHYAPILATKPTIYGVWKTRWE